jgi:hypothetical protein
MDNLQIGDQVLVWNGTEAAKGKIVTKQVDNEGDTILSVLSEGTTFLCAESDVALIPREKQ